MDDVEVIGMEGDAEGGANNGGRDELLLVLLNAVDVLAPYVELLDEIAVDLVVDELPYEDFEDMAEVAGTVGAV